MLKFKDLVAKFMHKLKKKKMKIRVYLLHVEEEKIKIKKIWFICKNIMGNVKKEN